MKALDHLQDLFYPNATVKSLAIQTNSLLKGVQVQSYSPPRSSGLIPTPDFQTWFYFVSDTSCTQKVFTHLYTSPLVLTLFSSDLLEVTTPKGIFKVPGQGKIFQDLEWQISFIKLLNLSPERQAFNLNYHHQVIKVVNAHFKEFLYLEYKNPKFVTPYLYELFAQSNLKSYELPALSKSMKKALREENRLGTKPLVFPCLEVLPPLCDPTLSVEEALFKSPTTPYLTKHPDKGPMKAQLTTYKESWVTQRNGLTHRLLHNLPIIEIR